MQKRIAAKILKVSPKKIRFDPNRLDEIKESITTIDVKSLIKDKAIKRSKEKGTSRARARKIRSQKSKGKRGGIGSRKGSSYARLSRKDRWITKIRAQRKFLKLIKEKSIISKAEFKDIIKKSKGGFFRSVRHIKLHINKLKEK